MPSDSPELDLSSSGSILADLATGHEALSVAKAAREPCLQRDGKSIHPSQLYRWADEGIDGARLEMARVGGRKVTTRSALLRFIARLSHIPEKSPSSARVHRQAMRELRQAGI